MASSKKALKVYGTAATAAVVVAVALTATLNPGPETPQGDAKPPAPEPEVRVGGRPAAGLRADPDAPVMVTLKGIGQLTDVTVRDDAGHRVAGRLDPSARVWRSTGPLRAETHYTAEIGTEPQQQRASFRAEFTTDRPRTEALRITLGPRPGIPYGNGARGSGGTGVPGVGAGGAGADGERAGVVGTYGVGQIITARLSRPVPRESRAYLEEQLHVSSSPGAGAGAWYWVDDTTLHYRPRHFWPAHAVIDVRADDLAGLRLADGLRVAPVQPLRVRTGARVEAVVDAAARQLSVLRDGTTLRVIPVTTGKAGYRTRAGVKVVLDKQSSLRMRSGTIGIPSDTVESYDLTVRHAIRITRSGEYLHAAPWATSSFGERDVSHGCVGMSDEDAAWLFRVLGEGDVTRTIHTEGPEMPPFSNGVGDWNLEWEEWLKGSALNGSSAEGADKDGSARGSSPDKREPGPLFMPS